MTKKLITTAALGTIAIILRFGAHALKKTTSSEH
jgi:hypothetical protein